jgi:hypothetical protein
VADGSTWVDVTMCRVDPFLSFSLRESPIGLDIEFKMLNQASDLIAQHEAMPAGRWPSQYLGTIGYALLMRTLQLLSLVSSRARPATGVGHQFANSSLS